MRHRFKTPRYQLTLMFGLAALVWLWLWLSLEDTASTQRRCGALLDHAQQTGEFGDYASTEARCGLIY